MIPVLALLILCGYFVVRGLLQERELLPALTLGTAISWGAFITILNLILRASVPFAVAAPAAAVIILALGIAVRIGARTSPLARASLDRRDLALLLIGAFPTSALILLYHFLGLDGDDFIHYPLVALFMKGYFPHFNPYFPDLALHGHYGRDLGLAGLVSFGGIGIGTAMMLEAWLLHIATLGNIYFLAKRSGAGRGAGAMAAYFAFFAVNAGFADWIVRSGLAEVMGNVNPVAHAFLFAILNLTAIILQRPNRWAVVMLGLLLGGFDIVYETHFIITAIGLSILTAALLLPPLRTWIESQPGRSLAVGLALSILVVIPSGGLTSQMALRKLGLMPRVTNASDAYDFALAGAQQRVDVHFPKQPFLSLTHARDGRPVSLFSWQFMKGQGISFWLLPLSCSVLAIRRRTLGLVCASMALASIAVPATFDFGRFNGENFRLIFFSGLMASVAFGMLLGEGFEWLTRHGHQGKPEYAWLGICLLVALLPWQSTRFYKHYRYAHSTAVNFPHLFRVSELERLERFAAEYGASDEEATAYLVSHGVRGDRMASNYMAPYQKSREDLTNNSMVIMTRAQIPMVGFDARIMRDGGGIRSSVQGWSARARAYWATGDEEILRDLGADWLYVVPKWLLPAAAEGIARSKAVREAFRSTKEGERIVYRVDLGSMMPRPDIAKEALEGLSVASVTGLDGGRLEQFVLLPLRLRNDGRRKIQLRIYVYYRIYDRTARAPYDERDAVGTVHALDVKPGGEMRLNVPFVFPYNEGDYEVTFFAPAGDGDVKLGSFQFSLRPKA